MKKPSFSTQWMGLLVFGLFALCLLLTLLSGAGIYRRITARGQEQDRQRTALQYLTTRVRQAERLEVGSFEGCPALVFPEDIQGQPYLTRVYLFDGQLRELFCEAQAPLHPGDGEPIAPLHSLEIVLEEDLLTARVDDRLLILHIPSRKEVPG